MDPGRRSRVIPIEWSSLDALEARLRSYPPIGMFLCTTLHAHSDDDPATLIPRAPEADIVDGIGTFATWGGFVDGIPFSIRSAALEKLDSSKTGYGIEVWFPAFVDSDRSMFELVPELPLPPPRVEGIWIETLRPGVFGIARTGSQPIYTCTSRSDALAAIELVDRWHPGAYAMVDAEEPTDWLVAGPTTDRFVSMGWRFSSEESARHRAAERSTKHGAAFTARPCRQ